MNRWDSEFLWFAFWLYLASFIVFSLFASIKRRRIGMLGAMLFSLAFCSHAMALGARWKVTGYPPFSTMYEFAVTMSWAGAAVAIFAMVRYRNARLGVPISALLVSVIAAISLLPSEPTRNLMPALQSYWFYIHVSLAALSEGAFIVAAGAGFILLFSGGKPSSARRDEARVQMEDIILHSIRIGYPLFTVGALFAGAIWAHYAWGSFWSWDPKETGSLVVWLFYTLVIHQNARGRWTGNGLAIAAIIGLILAIISFLGNLVFGGLHSYV